MLNLFCSFLTFLAVSLIVWVYCKLSCGICKCSRHLVGKVVIVTGANAGIGFETAKDLAHRGARVILACRNPKRGTRAVEHIVEATGNTDVHYRELDLCSFDSVKTFAAKILATENRLDVLINNAGVLEGSDVMEKDGMLTGMKTNHFGPFVLTNLLLPLMKSSAPSRIVNVNSLLHYCGYVDFEHINSTKGMKKSLASFQVYSNAKLFNVLTTLELAKRLEGTGVTANCLHPGVIMTHILTDVSVFWIYVATFIMNLFSKTIWEGAQTQINLAVSPEVSDVSGKYFVDCRIFAPKAITKDVELARKVWDVSEKIVGFGTDTYYNNRHSNNNSNLHTQRKVQLDRQIKLT